MKKSQSILCAIGCMLSMALLQDVTFAATQNSQLSKNSAVQDIEITGWMQRSKYFPKVASAYFKVTNKGHKSRLISGVTSPECAKIFAHHSDQESTDETANLFSHFTIPADMTLVFPEGGYHLVCLNFPQNHKPGDKIKFIFKFLNGASIEALFPLQGET